MFDYLQNNLFDILAALVGLIYLYLEFKANIWMWLVSMLMALLFVYTFYQSGLYASMCIYIYFFVASIYGWIRWVYSRKENKSAEDIILNMPKGKILGVYTFFMIAFAIIYSLLFNIEMLFSYLHLGDVTSTALNVVALWMASRKWAEQWCLLVPANLISGVMLHYQGNYATAIMFYIYAVVSVAGYFNWRKLANRF